MTYLLVVSRDEFDNINLGLSNTFIKYKEKNMNDKSKRISELDYMRGFALLGIILTNIITLYKFPTPNNLDQVKYLQFIDFFVEDKFFTIFSFLFGVGFYIFIRNLKQKDLNSNFVFLRRLAILAVFGLLHQLLQPGEALLL